MLLDLVPSSCRHLCGRGLCRECAPQTSTSNEMFPPVANPRLVREAKTVMCYTRSGGGGNGRRARVAPYSSPSNIGVLEKIPEYFKAGYNHPLEERIDFSFLGTAMMISLAQEYTSRAHGPQNKRTYYNKVTLVPLLLIVWPSKGKYRQFT